MKLHWRNYSHLLIEDNIYYIIASRWQDIPNFVSISDIWMKQKISWNDMFCKLTAHSHLLVRATSERFLLEGPDF